jgi:glycosyltransferase involved in cell wall biosynthesis
MKVLFIASVYRHFTSFHIPYMKTLQNMGYEVWASASNEEEHKTILEDNNIKCLDIPFSRSPISLNNLKAYKEIKSVLEKYHFDLIHVHTPVASFLSRIAYRNINHGKLLYTAHGFHFYKGAPIKNWLIYYPAEKIVRRWTDGIIVINNEDYVNAKKIGYSTNLFITHGVGVNIERKKISVEDENLLRIELGIPNEAIVISYIAELNDNKNHMFLLENWTKIQASCPKSFLLLIGEGENRSIIEKYISENNLNNIKILGYRRDVDKILKITDIVSLLSKREGLPKSIMEAMAVSIPCIVTNTRGLRDLIQNNVNGYVVNHEDHNQLVNGFVKLICNEELRIKMGSKAFQFIQEYSLQNVVNEYKEIYKVFLKK